MMIGFLPKRNYCTLEIYEICKYQEIAHETEPKKIRYTGVEGFEVVSDPERVKEIERDTDGSCIDEYHEYLVIYFENGETATFRNSHVDLFHF